MTVLKPRLRMTLRNERPKACEAGTPRTGLRSVVLVSCHHHRPEHLKLTDDASDDLIVQHKQNLTIGRGIDRAHKCGGEAFANRVAEFDFGWPYFNLLHRIVLLLAFVLNGQRRAGQSIGHLSPTCSGNA